MRFVMRGTGWCNGRWTGEVYTYIRVDIHIRSDFHIGREGVSGQLGKLGLILHCDVIKGSLALLFFFSWPFLSSYFFMRQRLYTDTRAV